MHLPALIQDLAVILGVAAVITFIFRRIKQPVVLGYIVAGIVVGPYTPAVFSVTDPESIKVWAELGVIFLMFTLGLEFSFRRLARVGMSAGITGIIQITAMLFAGIVTANVLGWSSMDAVFLGCMIAISSTTIIIKALEELGLKSKKFAELVFGILIVEDLAAILMLVALTNVATTSQIGGVQLLLAGGKLAIVVGAWFVVGMFLVPRFVKSVSKHGNDEMLTVVAIGLCLALVALAAYFQYSVALGAFIMGSIIAESAEAKRIEHLVQPLKDIFGAVFFVSVGMLLDPRTVIDNLGAVVLISAVVIGGKLLSVTLGAFVTGQTVKSSVQTGFSMAQIGEFSFIIATLGLSYKVIDAKLYPIVVAASLVTTFATPYLVKASTGVAAWVEGKLPDRARLLIDNYVAWVQRRSVTNERRRARYKSLAKWAAHGVIVATILTLAADKLLPIVQRSLAHDLVARGVAWLAGLAVSLPSIWAMLDAFREGKPGRERGAVKPHGGTLLASRIVTAAVVGLLSAEFFPAPVALGVILTIFGGVFAVFRRQIGDYYRWVELQFQSGFQTDLLEGAGPHDRLAPWDAHLVEVKVPARSFLVGKSLQDLQLRERYGLNVVVVVREGQSIVAPKANVPLYPGDSILCFATDAEIERFKDDVDADRKVLNNDRDIGVYDLKRFVVSEDSKLKGKSIRSSGIREQFDCIVVGLERQGRRIRSPKSDASLAAGDVLWVVGEDTKLKSLSSELA